VPLHSQDDGAHPDCPAHTHVLHRQRTSATENRPAHNDPSKVDIPADRTSLLPMPLTRAPAKTLHHGSPRGAGLWTR
jgi:hypothetical protein